MRDVKRIKRILKLIEELWTKAPDMRLGQLLQNYASFSGKDFNVEDDDTELMLKTNIQVFEMHQHFHKTGEMICNKCKKPFKKIDKYTFQPDCEDYNKNMRLCVG